MCAVISFLSHLFDGNILFDYCLTIAPPRFPSSPPPLSFSSWFSTSSTFSFFLSQTSGGWSRPSPRSSPPLVLHVAPPPHPLPRVHRHHPHWLTGSRLFATGRTGCRSRRISSGADRYLPLLHHIDNTPTYPPHLLHSLPSPQIPNSPNNTHPYRHFLSPLPLPDSQPPRSAHSRSCKTPQCRTRLARYQFRPLVCREKSSQHRILSFTQCQGTRVQGGGFQGAPPPATSTPVTSPHPHYPITPTHPQTLRHFISPHPYFTPLPPHPHHPPGQACQHQRQRRTSQKGQKEW